MSGRTFSVTPRSAGCSLDPLADMRRKPGARQVGEMGYPPPVWGGYSAALNALTLPIQAVTSPRLRSCCPNSYEFRDGADPERHEIMHAYRVEKPGGRFQEIELPRPAPATHQVLVRIYASGVNPLDTKIRAGGAPHAKQPLPAVLGLDMAGTVEELGAGVTAFRPGDDVYGMVGGVGGLQGTLAEFIAVDASLLARKPTNLSMRQAAALPLIAITAWEGLVDRAKVHADQTVLIQAGAGGVGHVAVQLARAHTEPTFSPPSLQRKGTLWRASEPLRSIIGQ